MGQRTTTILKYEFMDEHRPSDNFTAVKVYYHQWGIGRGVPAQMMGILNNQICNSIWEEEGLKYLQPAGTDDETPDLLQQKEYAVLLDEVGFERPDIIGKIMLACGNNNGGVYMHLVRKMNEKLDTTYDIKYAFLTGDSVEKGKFVTKEEWLKVEGFEYVDKKFRQLFEDTMDYWGAVDVMSKGKKVE